MHPLKASHGKPHLAEESFDLDAVADLYAKAHFWHGTGRCQWRYGHEDINEGEVDSAEKIDVLSFLIEDGLKPHEDRFSAQFGADVTKTISLTKARMYGALYAKLFQTEGDSLGYEYGSNLRWGSLYTLGTTIALIQDKKVWSDWAKDHWGHIRMHGLVSAVRRFAAFQSNATRDQVNWTRNLRREPLSAWRALLSGGVSDIEGNHPILLGIPHDAVEPVSARYSYLGAYETRASNVISLDACTHMEVPSQHVQNVRDQLQESGVDLPVLPMEAGELFMSKMSLSRLLEMDRK